MDHDSLQDRNDTECVFLFVSLFLCFAMKANCFPSDLYFLGKLSFQLRPYCYGTVPSPMVKKMTFKVRFARYNAIQLKGWSSRHPLERGGCGKKSGGTDL